MDNNNSDPNNPASAPVLGQPAEGMSPADPANTPWQPAAQDTPQAPPAPDMNQPQGTPPQNPWDNLNQAQTTANPSNLTPDIFTSPAQPSVEPPPVEPPPAAQTQWPSSAATSGFEAQTPGASNPVVANPPAGLPTSDQTQQNPVTDNPFLQPQNLGMSMPESTQPVSDLGQPLANPGFAIPGSESAIPATPLPGQTPESGTPLEPPSTIPIAQEPMSGAFPPAGATGGSAPPPPQTPEAPETPAAFPDEQPPGSMPAPISPETPQENPAQGISGQSGTLDLSTLQSNSGSAENPFPQAGNPLPDMGPQENAPTDLSHLIAGDESHHQPGDVYAPPIAQDQNPTVSPIQSPTAADGTTPPPEKHLNLTKVLLIAGIPVILIVAALSAYLILGIGKPASPDTTNQTSLPVEKTKQQAPLTNPPQQITAPSPVSIPSQTQDGSESSGSGVVLPVASASLSPAMQAALKKASPSPSTTP